MATVDATVVDCKTLFEQAMELAMTLEEDPNLQILSTNIPEFQKQYDEVRAMVHSIAIVQCFAKFQQGKHLLAQVEATQKKEVVFKAKLCPWLK